MITYLKRNIQIHCSLFTLGLLDNVYMYILLFIMQYGFFIRWYEFYRYCNTKTVRIFSFFIIMFIALACELMNIIFNNFMSAGCILINYVMEQPCNAGYRNNWNQEKKMYSFPLTLTYMVRCQSAKPLLKCLITQKCAAIKTL